MGILILLGIGATDHNLLIQTKTTAGIGIILPCHDPAQRGLTQTILHLLHREDTIILVDIAKRYFHFQLRTASMILHQHLYIFWIVYNLQHTERLSFRTTSFW